MDFEMIEKEDGNKVVKFEGKEYGPTEFKNMLDRDKNLQSDYTKNKQALAEREKAVAELETFAKDLDANPALAKAVEDAYKSFSNGTPEPEKKAEGSKDSASGGEDKIAQLEKEINAMKNAQTQKELEAQKKQIISEYDGVIQKELDGHKVNSEKLRKHIRAGVWGNLIGPAKGKLPEAQEVKEEIDSLIAELREEFPAALKNAKTEHAPVTGNRGQGGVQKKEKEWSKDPKERRKQGIELFKEKFLKGGG